MAQNQSSGNGWVTPRRLTWQRGQGRQPSGRRALWSKRAKTRIAKEESCGLRGGFSSWSSDTNYDKKDQETWLLCQCLGSWNSSGHLERGAVVGRLLGVLWYTQEWGRHRPDGSIVWSESELEKWAGPWWSVLFPSAPPSSWKPLLCPENSPCSRWFSILFLFLFLQCWESNLAFHMLGKKSASEL